MNWERKSRCHIVSSEGYTISKFFIKNKKIYQAFTQKDAFDYETLGLFNSASDAKNACEAHYEK